MWFCFMFVFVFLFSQTKWHARWDTILLPFLRRFNGRHKILHDLLVLALHWTMFAVDTSFSLRHKAGKCLSLDDRDYPIRWFVAIKI
jgi:hypothetical protein